MQARLLACWCELVLDKLWQAKESCALLPSCQWETSPRPGLPSGNRSKTESRERANCLSPDSGICLKTGANCAEQTQAALRCSPSAGGAAWPGPATCNDQADKFYEQNRLTWLQETPYIQAEENIGCPKDFHPSNCFSGEENITERLTPTPSRVDKLWVWRGCAHKQKHNLSCAITISYCDSFWLLVAATTKSSKCSSHQRRPVVVCYTAVQLFKPRAQAWAEQWGLCCYNSILGSVHLVSQQMFSGHTRLGWRSL